MMFVGAYALGLSAALVVCMASQRPTLTRSAFVLIANWLGVLIAVRLSGRNDPAAAFLALDVACGIAVLWHPASRPQAAIGLLYMTQIGVHFAYLVGGSVGEAQYLSFIGSVGWGQIAILIMGAIYGSGRKVGGSGRDRRGGSRGLVAHGVSRLAEREREQC